jgi:hypothetical protein
VGGIERKMDVKVRDEMETFNGANGQRWCELASHPLVEIAISHKR